VQETYLKAQRSFDSFVPGSNPRPWMFKILKNTFLSSRSKLDHKMTEALELPEEIAVSSNPESLLISHFNREAIQYAILELPVAFREVLSLRYVEEASYGEIAELLAIPIGTVMSRLARARKLVRTSCLKHQRIRDTPRRRVVEAARTRPATKSQLRSAEERILC
jgi:RNA polymerase sigma-70 factor, ECF subfamily